MLTAAYIISFTGMILLPILLWIYFTRNFSLSWRLVLAGALTFVAAQVLHIPLVAALGSFLQNSSLVVNAIVLGLLAGIFEETARYTLFRYILKNARTWKEGVLVGLGHGGVEALLLGILSVVTFVTMIGYRSIDLSTVPSIPAEQLELARQQVAAYWSSPWYVALLGFVERIFAVCLHVSLSVMVLYAVAYGRPVWFWLALLWHAFVDAVAVYVVQQVGVLEVEGIVAIFAMISLWIVFRLRQSFYDNEPRAPAPETVAT
ncbi:MAG TPA: YhfC family glutamic-type intramembrane protease [Anaerolineales bacterium]|nr:YhfC family glutamic-type intramembrane protease [Anaerolineales bacterium]